MATNADLDPQLRIQATSGLDGSAKESRTTLLALLTGNDADVRREALRAYRGAPLSQEEAATVKQYSSPNSEFAALVNAVVSAESLKKGRPEARDTAAWLKRLDALGGSPDPKSGERIFHHAKFGLCANCHRHNGRGNVVGPDLSAGAGRGDRASILRAILEPNRDVAPQFYPWSLVTTDGKTFTGILLRKGGSSGKEFYRDISGQERGFVNSDIEMRRETKTSLMPQDLTDLMTEYEIRDLLAFLMK